MKTLIVCGSPRKNGHTSDLISKLTANLNGEHEILYTYDQKFSPCIDCRFCSKNIGCVYNDDFSVFLEKLEKVDNFIVASPLYFGSLTGQMMSFFSRFQTYYANRFVREQKIEIKPKNMALILTSGMGYPNIEYLAVGQYNYILGEANGTHLGTVHLKKTDFLTDELLEKSNLDIKNLCFKFNNA